MDLSFIKTNIFHLQTGFPTKKERINLIKTLNLHQMVALLIPSKVGSRQTLPLTLTGIISCRIKMDRMNLKTTGTMTIAMQKILRCVKKRWLMTPTMPIATTTQWCQNRGSHWPPQYLAYQLTLFKTGVGKLSPPITTGPSQCFSPSGITVKNRVPFDSFNITSISEMTSPNFLDQFEQALQVLLVYL